MSRESRIDDLEILLAHQARIIEDLSNEVRRQGLAVDRLETALRQIGERVRSIEPAPEVTRPPHY